MKKINFSKLFATCSASLILLSAAACSSTGTASSNSSAAASTASTPASSQTAAEVKTIKVGVTNTVPIFLQTDENGNPDGYDIDVLKAIDEKLPQYKFEYKEMRFAALAVSLQAGQIDMADGTFNRTAEREKKFLIPKTDYGYVPVSLIVKKDSPIKDLTDCKGKTVIQEPTTMEFQYLQKFNKDNPGTAYKLNGISGLTEADAYKMVADGRCDAFMGIRTSFDSIQKELNLNIKLTDKVLFKESYVQMINKDNKDLCDAVDKALSELKTDGTLGKISKKWLGMDLFADAPSSDTSSVFTNN
jgi:L-cystine transport system substrate-binding protein